MSKATEQGFVVGNLYRLIENDNSFSHFKQGDIVRFERDDETDIPLFRRERDKDTGYVPLSKLAPAKDSDAVFEEHPVTTFETVVRISRKLTQAEKAAIQQIIDQGA